MLVDLVIYRLMGSLGRMGALLVNWSVEPIGVLQSLWMQRVPVLTRMIALGGKHIDILNLFLVPLPILSGCDFRQKAKLVTCVNYTP